MIRSNIGQRAPSEVNLAPHPLRQARVVRRHDGGQPHLLVQGKQKLMDLGGVRLIKVTGGLVGEE